MAKRRKRKPVHTQKWDRCIAEVKAKGGAAVPAAVCTARLGERGSILKKHRRQKARRRNPKPASSWVIIARKKNSRPLFFEGTRFAAGRAQSAVRFSTRESAAVMARSLKRQYGRALKGVNLRVSGV